MTVTPAVSIKTRTCHREDSDKNPAGRDKVIGLAHNSAYIRPKYFRFVLTFGLLHLPYISRGACRRETAGAALPLEAARVVLAFFRDTSRGTGEQMSCLEGSS